MYAARRRLQGAYPLDCNAFRQFDPKATPEEKAILHHHGAAAYDEGKEVVFKNATVTKYTWANPHAIIEFDAKHD